ncbi:uncharacterized protein LOC133807065 [Humulus lupulus]|uniref:uncharacterized protein LOC133807065 n=1 Tax=Humulus lupulus TaxID=3486 RepID=UPI002B400963|nr:uncharacterized protein LOC133807065 [Humulus lupulus]
MKEIIEKVNDAMKKSIKNFQQETSEQIGREIANLRENIVKDISLDLLEKIQTQNEPAVYMTSDKSPPEREEKAEEVGNDPSSPDDGLKGNGSESEPEIPLPEDDKDYE